LDRVFLIAALAQFIFLDVVETLLIDLILWLCHWTPFD